MSFITVAEGPLCRGVDPLLGRRKMKKHLGSLLVFSLLAAGCSGDPTSSGPFGTTTTGSGAGGAPPGSTSTSGSGTPSGTGGNASTTGPSTTSGVTTSGVTGAGGSAGAGGASSGTGGVPGSG